MKKALLVLVCALVLTIPAYIVIVTNPWARAWWDSGAGPVALAPFYRMSGSVGVEGDDNVLTVVLLAVSFVSSLVVCYGCSFLFKRRLRAGS